MCHDQILNSYIFSSTSDSRKSSVMDVKLLNQYHSCLSITPLMHDPHEEVHIPDYENIDYLAPSNDIEGDFNTQVL